MLCKEHQEYPNPKEHLMLSIMLWGGGINHLFIGKIVNLFAKIKVRFRFFNKISRLSAILASKIATLQNNICSIFVDGCKQLFCFNMRLSHLMAGKVTTSLKNFKHTEQSKSLKQHLVIKNKIVILINKQLAILASKIATLQNNICSIFVDGCKQLFCFNMRLSHLMAGSSLYRFKQSFSMISLTMYLMISALAVSITLGAIAIVDNAKIAKTIDEIEYYQKANSEFIVRYSALPGLVPYSECLRFADFNDVCRNQNDINLTTSENVYKSTTNDCNHDMGCIIETNGKAGNEDIMRNFLLPMRYLKTAGLIDTIKIGLETELDENEDYSTKVWAKSRVDKELYINIYNYYNPTRNTSKPFLFTGQTIFGHTINSDASFDHYNKLVKSNNQYLLYLKKSSNPRGAISSKIAHKIDKKFDDGKPMTGRLTTFSTSTFSDDFESSEYAGCITAQPNNKENLDDISYNISKNSGYCNIAYQLQNFSSAVMENDKTTLLADTKYENGTRYKTYSDGTVIQDEKTDENTLQGYEVEYTYSDGSTKTMKPTCSCNQETKILSCNYEDGTTKSFYPLGDVCTYDNATGKQTCTYETGTQCDVELTQTDYQNNCTVQNSIMTCNYVNKGAIPETKTYTTTKKDCANSSTGTACETGTAYYCDTFNNKIVGTCQTYGIGYCNSGNVGSNCNDGSGNPASYKCGTLNAVINTKHQQCIQKQSTSCSNNSGNCTQGYNYVCNVFGTEIYGTCQPTTTSDCANTSGTCTAGNKNKCKVLNNDIISGSCQAYSFLDCSNNTAGQACNTTGNLNYNCRLFDNKIVDCQAYAYNQECSDKNGTCTTGNAYACTTLNRVIKDGTCREISHKYCKKVNDNYSDCQDAPTSTSHTSHCKFYGDTNTNECETKSTSSRYCTSSTTAYNKCYPAPQYTNDIYYCPFVGDQHAGECETKTVSKRYCATTTTAYNSCHEQPQSTSEKYYCPFVGDLHAGECETKTTANLYCATTTTAYNSCHTSPSSTSEKYYCPFVGDRHAGSCWQRTVYYDCYNRKGCSDYHQSAGGLDFDTCMSYNKYWCAFADGSCIGGCFSNSDVSYQYCTDAEGKECNGSIQSTSQYYCSFRNGFKVSCGGNSTSNCSNNTTGQTCTSGSTYTCTMVNGKIASCQ